MVKNCFKIKRNSFKVNARVGYHIRLQTALEMNGEHKDQKTLNRDYGLWVKWQFMYFISKIKRLSGDVLMLLQMTKTAK